MPAVSRVSRTPMLRLLLGAMVIPGSLAARQIPPSRPANNYWVYVGAESAGRQGGEHGHESHPDEYHLPVHERSPARPAWYGGA